MFQYVVDREWSVHKTTVEPEENEQHQSVTEDIQGYVIWCLPNEDNSELIESNQVFRTYYTLLTARVKINLTKKDGVMGNIEMKDRCDRYGEMPDLNEMPQLRPNKEASRFY